jgi:hypothetical protein
MFGECLSEIASIHYINKAILCHRSNYAGNISEEILNSHDGEGKTYTSAGFTKLRQ